MMFKDQNNIIRQLSSYQSVLFKKRLNSKNKPFGFTVVELLVVIVVIGILAAISIVSYTGIREKAVVSSIKAQLTMDSKILKMYYIDHGVYPSALDVNYCPTAPAVDNQYCIKNMNGSTLTYTGGDSSFTLTITNGSISYSINEDGDIAQAGGGSVLSSASFMRTLGGPNEDNCNSLVQTSDGGYVITGSSSSFDSTGEGDAFIAKYTNEGVLSWSKTWGGDSYDTANRVIQTSDGGYAMAGETRSYTSANSDAFLAKYTADGTLSWSKTWGGIGYNQAYGLISTTDGGYAISGYTNGFGSGGVNAFILKYDSEGVLVWNKTWGGAAADFANGIIEIDNGYIIAGYTESFGAGGSDAFVARYESDGTLSWSKTWGWAQYDQANSITADIDGGFVIAGMGNIDGSNDDAFITKYNSSGDLVWNKTWGGMNSDEADSVAQIKDGGYIITGYSSSYASGIEDRDVFIAKFANDGTYSSSSSWGGTHGDFANVVYPSADGGYIVGGRTGSFSFHNDDAFIAKYAADGTIIKCSSPMCKPITDASIVSTLATVYSPTASAATPSATTSTPSPSTESPAFVSNIIDDDFSQGDGDGDGGDDDELLP